MGSCGGSGREITTPHAAIMNEFIEEEIAAIMQFEKDEEKERRDTKKNEKRKKALKDTENIRRTRLLK